VGLLVTSLAWIILAVNNLSWQISPVLRFPGFTIHINGIPVLAVVALFAVAIGEMIQSPRYYEYISRLAPPGQQGTYMGYAFLPIGIGFFIAGSIGGRLVHYFGEVLGKPQQMWWVISGVGVFSTLLMIVYDRIVKPSGQEAAG
jgi:proton-dependent oligopeptide transporter, POT family